MEIKQIYDCQEILNFISEAKTEEELKCDKLFRDKSTIEWLSERKNTLDNEIKGIEGKILVKNGVLSKKKAKESEKEEISKILESKTNNLNDIKVAESDIKLQESLKSKISEVEKKIEGYKGEIEGVGYSKYKIGEEIKNKETNERNWETHVSSAKRELNSAENDFASATKRGESFGGFGITIGSWGECWDRDSPELSSSCVQRYRKKVEEKKNTKESYERTLNTARGELKEEKDKSKKLSETIASLNSKKNEEIAKKDQYIKEKQQVETKIQGVLDQKKSLETDIEKQHAEQMKINEELLSLEKNAKNIDSNALEAQKDLLEQEFQDTDAFEYKLLEYQEKEIPDQIQHQEL